MGFKWFTCTLFCFLGIANLLIDVSVLAEEIPKKQEGEVPATEFGGKKTPSGFGKSSFDSSSSASGRTSSGSFSSFGNSGEPFSAYAGQAQFGIPEPERFPRPDNFGTFRTNAGSYPYYPNQNAGPGYNFEDLFQSYFRAIEEQQKAFQAQLRSQFQQYQPQETNGDQAWAQAEASITDVNGVIDPNTRIYSESWSSVPTVTTSKSNMRSDHLIQQNGADYGTIDNENRFYRQQDNFFGNGYPLNNDFPNQPYNFANRNGFNNYGGFRQNYQQPNFDVSNSFETPNDVNYAHAFVNSGPDGGFHSVQIGPVPDPSIVSRITEETLPPGGHYHSTYSKSVSGQTRGPDGKITSYKLATTGENKDGKIKWTTVHYP